MANEVSVYLIVVLITLVQMMLIWRLKFAVPGKWKYQVLAVAIPVLIIVSMRLAIASGVIHGRVADQSPAEQYVTTAASILLIAGPCFATLAAFVAKGRKGSAKKAQTDSKRIE